MSIVLAGLLKRSETETTRMYFYYTMLVLSLEIV